MENDQPHSEKQHTKSLPAKEDKQTGKKVSMEKGQLRALLRDVMQLAVYAVENGKLPQEVSIPDIYTLWHKKIEKGEMLADDEVTRIGQYYSSLSQS